MVLDTWSRLFLPACFPFEIINPKLLKHFGNVFQKQICVKQKTLLKSDALKEVYKRRNSVRNELTNQLTLSHWPPKGSGTCGLDWYQ